MKTLVTCSCGLDYKIITYEPPKGTTLVTCECLEVMRLRGRIERIEIEDANGLWQDAEVLLRACA
jgi:hypothetical protein